RRYTRRSWSPWTVVHQLTRSGYGVTTVSRYRGCSMRRRKAGRGVASRCYTRRAPGSVSKTAARGAFSMRNLAPLALFTLVVVLVLTACGGGGGTGSLGSSDVIVVGGQHVSKDDLNTMMERAKKSYQANKQKFPKPGTQEYIALQGQALTYLLQRAELAQRAKQLGVKVSDKEVQDRVDLVKKQSYGNDEKKFEAALKQQGLTVDQYKTFEQFQLLSEDV